VNPNILPILICMFVMISSLFIKRCDYWLRIKHAASTLFRPHFKGVIFLSNKIIMSILPNQKGLLNSGTPRFIVSHDSLILFPGGA
jgi:hypothetical protein